jgi:hypothetical protein
VPPNQEIVSYDEDHARSVGLLWLGCEFDDDATAQVSATGDYAESQSSFSRSYPSFTLTGRTFGEHPTQTGASIDSEEYSETLKADLPNTDREALALARLSKDYAITIRFNAPIRHCRNRFTMWAVFSASGQHAAPIVSVIATPSRLGR